MNNRGVHVLLNAYLADMPSADALVRMCEDAIADSNMEVIVQVRKDFKPHGLTAVWILAESHFTIHTYPEHRFVSADCYTCGDRGDPRGAMLSLIKHLSPIKCEVRDFERG